VYSNIVEIIFLLNVINNLKMKKLTLLFFLLSFLETAATAQTTPEDSVKAVITQFFTGMKTGDTTAIRAAFTEGVIFQSIARTKEGETMVKTESVDAFIKTVAKENGNLDERITFGQVLIDGALASVWTPYNFFYKGQFAHCGVNSFQLVKINGNWRIQYLIDTRRKKGCE
jgi:Putative lumazine-binding